MCWNRTLDCVHHRKLLRSRLLQSGVEWKIKFSPSFRKLKSRSQNRDFLFPFFPFQSEKIFRENFICCELREFLGFWISIRIVNMNFMLHNHHLFSQGWIPNECGKFSFERVFQNDFCWNEFFLLLRRFETIFESCFERTTEFLLIKFSWTKGSVSVFLWSEPEQDLVHLHIFCSEPEQALTLLVILSFKTGTGIVLAWDLLFLTGTIFVSVENFQFRVLRKDFFPTLFRFGESSSSRIKPWAWISKMITWFPNISKNLN